MSGNFHFGDNVTQHGDHNVGMIKNQVPTDPQAAFREMITAVQVLRGQVSAADRQVIDESMKAIGTGEFRLMRITSPLRSGVNGPYDFVTRNIGNFSLTTSRQAKTGRSQF